MAQMNAIIHDVEVKLVRGDTMINPKFRNADGTIKQHDIVAANPIVEPAVRDGHLRQRPV